ncbi:MAG: glycosyltransferase family 2 protein [Myxococcales bacterium]|nr:glycosyltransferase family 2 protein [Myxococcales bacterium]
MKIAVVVPCYKVRNHILDLLSRIGPEVAVVFVVDDGCPEQSGQLVAQTVTDPRVQVIFHETNQGVGGAMITGYRAALAADIDIVVKVDGDGQMDPALIGAFVAPLAEGEADYTKGNRFFELETLESMPKMRVFGNSVVSFVNKVAGGYWNLMDPANGYTAITKSVLAAIPLDKLDRGYFFESDMLFRLNTLRAVVVEIPMKAVYGLERSNMRLSRISMEFPGKYLVRFLKRIFYNYFLRDFNVCSIELVFGTLLMCWGVLFGGYHWLAGSLNGRFASAGTVMLAAMPFILGFQLLLAAVEYDVRNVPTRPLSQQNRAKPGRLPPHING